MFLFNILCYCYILDYFLPFQHFFNCCCFIFIGNNNCFFLFALNVLWDFHLLHPPIFLHFPLPILVF
jgi:hypothetical protein